MKKIEKTLTLRNQYLFRDFVDIIILLRDTVVLGSTQRPLKDDHVFLLALACVRLSKIEICSILVSIIVHV